MSGIIAAFGGRARPGLAPGGSRAASAISPGVDRVTGVGGGGGSNGDPLRLRVLIGGYTLAFVVSAIPKVGYSFVVALASSFAARAGV